MHSSSRVHAHAVNTSTFMTLCRVEKEVAADSKEARQFVQSPQTSTSSTSSLPSSGTGESAITMSTTSRAILTRYIHVIKLQMYAVQFLLTCTHSYVLYSTSISASFPYPHVGGAHGGLGMRLFSHHEYYMCVYHNFHSPSDLRGKRSGLSSVLQSLSKKPKMSTLVRRNSGICLL